MAPPGGGLAPLTLQEKLSKLREGWLVIVATVLQYTTGFSSTLIPILTDLLQGLSSTRHIGDEDKSDEAGSCGNWSWAITMTIFTVSMNLAAVLVSPLVRVSSPAFVAGLATTLQIGGLLIAAYTNSEAGIEIGFGVLVGAGAGISLVNNIIFVKRNFETRLVSLVFGVAITSICLLGLPIPYLMSFLKTATDKDYAKVIAVYAGLSGIGCVGAILMRSKTAEHQSAEAPSCSIAVRQTCQDFGALLTSGKFLFTAAVNSICFALMIYMLSLIPKINFVDKFYDQNIFENISLSEAEKRFANKAKFMTETTLIAGNSIFPLVFGFLGDSARLKRLLKQPKRVLYGLCSLQLAITVLCMNYITSLPLFILTTVLAAISFNGMLLLTNLVYIELYKEKQEFESAVSLSNLFRCMGTLIYPLLNLISPCSISDQLLTMATLLGALALLWIIQLSCADWEEADQVERAVGDTYYLPVSQQDKEIPNESGNGVIRKSAPIQQQTSGDL